MYNCWGDNDFDLYYSPTARTRETALTLSANSAQVTDLALQGCKQNFLEHVGQLKISGRNLVIVTHSHCLNELRDSIGMPLLDFNAGDEQFFGMALAYDSKATGDINPNPLACRLPSTWEHTL